MANLMKVNMIENYMDENRADSARSSALKTAVIGEAPATPHQLGNVSVAGHILPKSASHSSLTSLDSATRGALPSNSGSAGSSHFARGAPRVVQGSRASSSLSRSSTSLGRSRGQGFSEGGSSDEDSCAVSLLSALRGGQVARAQYILSEHPQCLNAAGVSPLNDVLPVLLHSLAAQYDSFGITGSERSYFDFFRSLWGHLNPHEQTNNRSLATLFYAACKFNQVDFVAWILPVIANKSTLSLQRLTVDKQYSYNKLRHCALHYVARNGNVHLLQHLSAYVSLPLLREASLLMQHPPGQEGMELSSLYVAASQRHAGFVRHALSPHSAADGAMEGDSSPSSRAGAPDAREFTAELRQLVLCLMVHGLVAMDDTPTLTWIVQDAVPALSPLIFALPMAFNGPRCLPRSPDHPPPDTPGAADTPKVPDSAPNCLGLHLCIYRMPPSSHQASSVPSAAAAAGIQAPVSPRLSAVERVKQFTRAYFDGAPPSSSDGDDTKNGKLTSQLVGGALGAGGASVPAPALRVFTWLLGRFPWLAGMPFAIAVGEGGEQHIEWRNAFHSACSVGHRAAAEALLQVDSNLLHKYTSSAATAVADAPLRRGSAVVENHPLWLALGQARMTQQYDFLRWLLQHYSEEAVHREVYAQCEGLFALVPEFVKTLCKSTGLRLRRFKQAGGGGMPPPRERSSASTAPSWDSEGGGAGDAESARAAAEASLLAELQAEADAEASSVVSGGTAASSRSGRRRRRRRQSRDSAPKQDVQRADAEAAAVLRSAAAASQAGQEREEEDQLLWMGPTAGEQPPPPGGVMRPVAHSTGIVYASDGDEDVGEFTPVTSALRRRRRRQADAAALACRAAARAEFARNSVPVRPPPAHTTHSPPTASSLGSGHSKLSRCASQGGAQDFAPPPAPAQVPAPELAPVHSPAPAPSSTPTPAPVLEHTPPAAAASRGAPPPIRPPPPAEEHRAHTGAGHTPRAAVANSPTLAAAASTSVDSPSPQAAGSPAAAGPTARDRGFTGDSFASEEHFFSDEEGQLVQVGAMKFNDMDVIAVGSSGTEVFRGSCGRRPAAIKRMQRRQHRLRESEIEALLDLDDGDASSGFGRHIVRYLDDAKDRNFLYLGMELCDCSLQDAVLAAAGGGSKAARAAAGAMGSDTWQSVQAVQRTAVDICLHIVRGVAHLHAHGIAHRDLKPSNILLKRGIAKLCDFGLARSLAADRSRHTATVVGGTPGWQPAEIVQARMKGKRMSGGRSADLFAVGCILFFVLSGGQHPFGPAALREGAILQRHRVAYACLEEQAGWGQGGQPTAAAAAAAQNGAAPAALDAVGWAAPEQGSLRLQQHHAACHLIRQLLPLEPQGRLDMQTALAHPLFWPAERSIAFIAHFSDIAKRLYGALPHCSASPALEALEGAFASLQGQQSWTQRLQAMDAEVGRVWPDAPAGAAAGGAAEDWKSPKQYAAMFARRGMHGLGVVRAIRNIAFSHAIAYVHAGTFSSLGAVHVYWLGAFPWLPVLLYDITVGGCDPALSEELRVLLPAT